MNWTRYKLLIISGGITVVLAGGLTFWILSTRGASNEVQSQITNLNQQQSRLSSEKPFPSSKNFEQLKVEQAKVVEQRDQLKALIRQGQLTPIEINRSRFGDYIKGEYVPGLRSAAKAATKGGEHGVILTDPDFGLTEYLNGALPETTRIPELTLELQTVSHLSRLLFDAGISELMSVKPVVDDEKNPRRRNSPMSPAPMPGMNMGLMNPMTGMPSGAQTDDGLSDLQKEKNRLFSFKDYRVEFKAYEDFFRDAMNSLVADSNQLVITELYVTNASEDLWPTYLEAVLGKGRQNQARPARTPTRPTREPNNELERLLMGAASSAPTADETENEVQIAGLAERRQNAIGGNLLNVVMVVRVYRLIDETSETEGGI
jgi:hypothetical protein